MKSIKWLFFSWLIAINSPAVLAAGKAEPMLENTWNSRMVMVDDDSMRVTTRKRVSGDMDEINEPGTSIYKTFQAIQTASLLRLALEAKNQSASYFSVSSVRNITTERERNRVTGQASESDFTFAPGQYSAEIDLGIEVTARLYPDTESIPADQSYYSVDEILKANGL